MLIKGVVFEFRRLKNTQKLQPKSVKSSFKAADDATLTVLRQKRSHRSFRVYAEHTPRGGDLRTGMVSTWATEEEARAKFDAAVAEAEEKGWCLVSDGDAQIWIPHSTEVGTVRLSDDRIEMVLEVASSGYSPYLIRGRRLPDGHYSGHHAGQPGDSVTMASWHECGPGEFRGVWREPEGAVGRRVLQFSFSVEA